MVEESMVDGKSGSSTDLMKNRNDGLMSAEHVTNVFPVRTSPPRQTGYTRRS